MVLDSRVVAVFMLQMTGPSIYSSDSDALLSIAHFSLYY